ncbi:MAG: hypothetical protein AAFV29_11140, partial [Myxococcota bacterium]
MLMRAPSVVLASAVMLCGCDLLDSATATTVLGGLVVATPATSIPNRLELDAEVFASAWVGERASPTSTAAPTPIGTATVDLTSASGAVSLPVTDAANGVYFQSSLTDANLVYVGGAQYQLTATIDGIRFGGSVEAPPALSPSGLVLDPTPTEQVPNLPDVGIHPANTALTVSWGSQFGRYAYLVVFREDPNAPTQPVLVYDNRPDTIAETLAFVQGTPPTSIRIPADTFAQDGLYAVTLVAMNRADDLLPDTFIGSPIESA